jgi:serine/threonine protein kinase
MGFSYITCADKSKHVVNIVSKLNKTASEYMLGAIPGGQLDLIYASSSAILFRGISADNKTVVCKVFYHTPRCRTLGQMEIETYRRLARDGVIEGVPHIYSYHDTGGTIILCMQDLRSDIYDLVCSMRDTDKIWASGIRDMVNLINLLHSKGIIHGDIKLENMAYDGGRWYMMDFGFSQIEKGANVSGTVPHLPPFVIKHDACRLTFEQRKRLDYYAFAFSMLTMFDLPLYERCSLCLDKSYRCEDSCCSRIFIGLDIEQLYRNCWGYAHPVVPLDKKGRWDMEMFLKNPHLIPVYKTLCNIVLSEVNVKAKTMLWSQDGTSCRFHDINEALDESNGAVQLEPITQYWDDLTLYIQGLA